MDSLGTEKVIRPGDLNLMTAGRGIVHSERTPDNLRGHPLAMSGLQTWLALPDDKEEIDPAFAHTEKSDLPLINDGGATGRVVIGSFEGVTSPVNGLLRHALCRSSASARHEVSVRRGA